MTTVGRYLYADSLTSTPYLHDGADDAADDLGLWEEFCTLPNAHTLALLELVNRQLATGSLATVICRAGELRVELVAVPC